LSYGWQNDQLEMTLIRQKFCWSLVNNTVSYQRWLVLPSSWSRLGTGTIRLQTVAGVLFYVKWLWVSYEVALIYCCACMKRSAVQIDKYDTILLIHCSALHKEALILHYMELIHRKVKRWHIIISLLYGSP